jgi:hypothetical protein
MSFAERLEQQVATKLQPGHKRCALANLFTDERLSEDDRAKLLEVVDTPKNDPRQVSAATIALALREEGIEISKTAIGDHRRKACRCYSRKEN